MVNANGKGASQGKACKDYDTIPKSTTERRLSILTRIAGATLPREFSKSSPSFGCFLMTQSASHTLLHISWYNQDMQSLRLSLFIVFANELLSVGQLHACTCFPLAPLLAAVLKTATFLL